MWGGRPWFAADGKSLYFHTNFKGRHHACRMDLEPLFRFASVTVEDGDVFIDVEEGGDE